ncbi:serine hydrolase domain-containing protein [Brachybacterium tyrofermentans]|uniref:serine hydrolase domain-containing protein n=1 Tax=Brachybacterium tyrofermentans TaxID=47848 RepID=UPI003F9198B5
MSSPLDDQPSDPHLADPAPTTTPPTRAATRRTALAGAAGAGAILALTGLAAGPRPARLGDVHGDAELAAALHPHLGGHRHVSAVVSDGGQQRFAGFGADETTEFEIGSVTKTFTGALLMDAVDRGDVSLETTVAEILGERAAGSEASDVTLAEIASQSSGLPRLPLTRVLASLPINFLRKDPYSGSSVGGVIDAALDASLSDRGEYAYSNLGVAFLGQLLATQTGVSWQELLRSRLLDPLGMTSTRAPFRLDEIGTDAPRGHGRSGLSAGAWTMHGYGPAGGIRSTGHDMALYLASMQDGSNPGAAGLEPLVERGEDSAVGIVWSLRTTDAGESLVQHNGMTGGFAAFCGFNQDSGRGVVLMTDSALSPDELGAGILDGSVTL